MKICSKPRNFKMDKLTAPANVNLLVFPGKNRSDSVSPVGWNRRPPLYGPRAELNCTR